MAKKNPTPQKKPSRSRSKKQSTSLVLPQLTPDQKLDLIGGGLVFAAILTILSLVSAQQGLLTELWISGLASVFGWGMYGVPLFLGAVGSWLILRRFGDRIPWPQPEQVAGVLLGFFVGLVTLHWIADRLIWPEVGLYALVDLGYGGGYIGAALLDLALKTLGTAGAVVLLIMGWLLAITFTAGVSPAEALQWLLTRRRAPAQPIQPLLDGFSEPLPVPTPKPAPVVLGQPVREPKRRSETGAVKEAPAPKGAEEHIDLGIQPLPSGSQWKLPGLADVLEVGTEQDQNDDFIRKQIRIIEETLASLGAPAMVQEKNVGPVVVQFGVEPQFITMRNGKQTKVKVSKIASLADDLALALEARSIRIEAPIPGKGLVGIEVPNMEPTVVALRDVMEAQAFAKIKGTIRVGLGQDVSGQAVAADLRAMPHLLIAGTTGSGKSECVNAIIAALLLQNSPDTLRMLLVDPKRVELTQYNGIPHLLAPVIVDVDQVVSALRWVMREMDNRYRRFAKVGARDIEGFNRRVVNAEDESSIPYIVVVVDELADLMLQAPEETERVICRLAQMARATGIHLVIATQRPSVDVVTGLIKANFPARIAFAVASSIDSRVILDTPGAERLLGRGDMLFMPPDAGQPVRLQGAFVSDRELERLISYWRKSTEPGAVIAQATFPERPAGLKEALVQPKLFPEFADNAAGQEFEDPLLPSAVEILLAEDRASISLLQRRMRIGYTRSARLVDLLSEMGIIAEDADKGQFRGVNRPVAEAFLRSVTAKPEEGEEEV